MKKLLIIPFFFSIVWNISAQISADSVIDINIENLKQHVYFFASDELEGRQAGTVGGQKAAQYIANKFQKYGLTPPEGQDNFYQPFGFIRRDRNEIKIIAGNLQFNHGVGFYVKNNFQIEWIRTRFVFLRYGIDQEDYSDFEGVKLKGKIAVMLIGKPEVEGLKGEKTKFSNRAKIQLAKSKGAKGVILIHTDDDEFQRAKQIAKFRTPVSGVLKSDENSFNGYPIFYFDKKSGEAFTRNFLDKEIVKSVKLFKQKKRKRPYSASIILETGKFVHQTKNVIGLIEGEIKDEYVVITAHYDHLGKRFRAIYNGADDNASGVASLLELARVFSSYQKQGIQPKRSIVFIAFSAEEEGMLGSEYFINHPMIPIERVTLNLNIDMIGRARKLLGKSVVYLVTSNEKVVDYHNMALKDYNLDKLKFNYSLNSKEHPKQVFYRSDHYHFHKKGIPFIFYHTNDHIDYHRSTDTARKIKYEALLEITRLILHVTKYSTEALSAE